MAVWNSVLLAAVGGGLTMLGTWRGAARMALARLAASGDDSSAARKAAREQRNNLWNGYTTLSLIGSKDVVDAASSVLRVATAVA
jgi:hypothetical protein